MSWNILKLQIAFTLASSTGKVTERTFVWHEATCSTCALDWGWHTSRDLSVHWPAAHCFCRLAAFSRLFQSWTQMGRAALRSRTSSSPLGLLICFFLLPNVQYGQNWKSSFLCINAATTLGAFENFLENPQTNTVSWYNNSTRKRRES